MNLDSLQIKNHISIIARNIQAVILKHPSFIESVQPYFKYILFLMWILGFLWINRMFIKDPVLRKWLIASLEEKSGSASGKSLTAFMFAHIIALGSLVSIVYADNHLMPEYMFISLLSFIAAVYGIKLAGKYADKNTDTTTSTSTTTTTDTSKVSNVEGKKIDIIEEGKA